MIELLDSQDGLVDRIYWSDESTFNLNGVVNRHNCYYWSEENPHKVIEKQPQSIGLNVWPAISSERILGPYFSTTPLQTMRICHIFRHAQ